jgi:hypothetical protein
LIGLVKEWPIHERSEGKMKQIPEHADEQVMAYRINAVDGQFLVVDSAGERVSTCSTEDAARAEIADCERDDTLWRDAKALVETAVESMMQKHGLDRETAEYWIASAAE